MQLNKLAKESVWAALTKISTLVYFMLMLAVLTRTLGQEGFGAWSYFYSAFTVVLLVSLLGFNDATRIFVARHRQGDFRKALMAGLLLRGVASAVFSIGLFLAAPRLASAMLRPEFTPLFQWSAVLVITQGGTEFLKAVFEGLHRIKFNLLINTLEHGGKLLLVLLWVTGAPALGNVLAVFIAATLATAILGGVVLYRAFYRNAPSEPLPPMIRPIAAYAVPMFALITGFVLAMELDSLMLGWFTNDAELGRYAAAKQLAGKLPHFGAMLAMGALQVYAVTDREDRAYLRRLTRKLMLMVGAIYAGIGVGIVLFADWFMPLLFGAEFAASAMPLKLMVPFIFVYGTSRILAGIMDYRGRAWARAGYLSIAVVTNFLLNLWFIPRYGAEGAALATSLSYLPYIVLNYWEVQRSLRDESPATGPAAPPSATA